MIKTFEFAERRQNVLKQIGPGGIIILPAAPLFHRNGDTEYPYRQQSDFYYLTGFEEPEAVMVLLPNRKDGEYIQSDFFGYKSYSGRADIPPSGITNFGLTVRLKESMEMEG